MTGLSGIGFFPSYGGIHTNQRRHGPICKRFSTYDKPKFKEPITKIGLSPSEMHIHQRRHGPIYDRFSTDDKPKFFPIIARGSHINHRNF